MGKDLVSVIIPVYNSEETIEETLDSVINQTYENIEIIIVDDCSSDGTMSLIEGLSENESKIRMVSLSENSGVAVARNRGIAEAKGSYLAFLDSDDCWKKNKLEKQLAFMINNDYEFAFTSYNRNEDDGNTRVIEALKSVDYRKMLTGNFIGCSTVMLKSDVIVDLSFPLLRKRQDYALWLKILKADKNIKAHGLNEILTDYKIRRSSLSSNKLRLIKYQWQLFRKIEKMNLVKALYYFYRSIITSFIK